MLAVKPSIKDLGSVKSEYKNILLSAMKFISDRFDKDISYHWIDTKLSLITGKDFNETDPLRAKAIVYSWIQGRGLESLSLHSEWIDRNCSGKADLNLAVSLKKIIAEPTESLMNAKKLNAGHLYFTINPGGMALERLEDGSWKTKVLRPQDPWNFSDIFVSRGLFSGSYVSGDKDIQLSAAEYIQDIYNGLQKGDFRSDQLSLAEGNPAGEVKNRFSHAPWMIMIGSMTLLLRKGIPWAFDSGISIIRYILKHFINTNGRWPELEEFDYIEFINGSGTPWVDEGKVLSDPGHALEFVGLSSQFLLEAEKTLLSDSAERNELEELKSFMFPIFRRNFTNGFSHKSGGIIKLLDLKTRETINGEMPWWSLPETMRAALGCFRERVLYGVVQSLS